MLKEGPIVVFAGVTFLLVFLVGGAMSLRLTGVRQVFVEAQDGKSEATSRFAAIGLGPSEVLDRVELAMEAVVLPLGAIAAGVVVGLFAGARPLLLTMLATSPLLRFFIATRLSWPRAWLAVCGSLLIACGSAHVAERLRRLFRSKRANSA
jgi:hypothetical protein